MVDGVVPAILVSRMERREFRLDHGFPWLMAAVLVASVLPLLVLVCQAIFLPSQPILILSLLAPILLILVVFSASGVQEAIRTRGSTAILDGSHLELHSTQGSFRISASEIAKILAVRSGGASLELLFADVEDRILGRTMIANSSEAMKFAEVLEDILADRNSWIYDESTFDLRYKLFGGLIVLVGFLSVGYFAWLRAIEAQHNADTARGNINMGMILMGFGALILLSRRKRNWPDHQE